MTEEKVFYKEIEEDCKKVIKKHVDGFLKDKVFNLKDCDFLINYLNEKIMNDLKNISEYFKYMLTIVLLQNDSCGLVQNTSCYFDVDTDGSISGKFVFKKISCIINLFCVSI